MSKELLISRYSTKGFNGAVPFTAPYSSNCNNHIHFVSQYSGVQHGFSHAFNTVTCKVHSSHNNTQTAQIRANKRRIGCVNVTPIRELCQISAGGHQFVAGRHNHGPQGIPNIALPHPAACNRARNCGSDNLPGPGHNLPFPNINPRLSNKPSASPHLLTAHTEHRPFLPIIAAAPLSLCSNVRRSLAVVGCAAGCESAPLDGDDAVAPIGHNRPCRHPHRLGFLGVRGRRRPTIQRRPRRGPQPPRHRELQVAPLCRPRRGHGEAVAGGRAPAGRVRLRDHIARQHPIFCAMQERERLVGGGCGSSTRRHLQMDLARHYVAPYPGN
ncbi:hypothetical protein Pelo_2387 [Pelomyxa schiedti]|nr:hypothetical protein Pelo_2387 [Pelomyxa schiedti]